MENTTLPLKTQYETLKSENPKVRIRDAARQLAVSEAELVAVGERSIALKPDFESILNEIKTLGYVMALTRNDHAVHERKGMYSKASFSGHIGLIVNPDIDLRLFMTAWRFGFAVHEGDRQSLQFFDKDGEAVHKVYLTEKSDVEAYHTLVGNYAAVIQGEPLQILPVNKTITEKPDEELDISGFQQAWRDFKDTHDFAGLLGEFGITPRQAMRVAPEDYATQISVASFKRIIEGVSERNLDIMVFIGNSGCIQIHTGKTKRLLQTGPWFNILDPEFNMHLREDGIESAWLVKTPSGDDLVTSLELYDTGGHVIAQFFGKRESGIPEQEEWRQVISDYAVTL